MAGITRLEFERRRRGLKRAALAAEIDCHPSWLGHLESGRWTPSATSPAVQRLVRFLGLPLDALLRVIEEPELAGGRATRS